MNDRQRGLVINSIRFIHRNAFKIFCHASLADAFGNGITVLGVQVPMLEP